jgi:hypothetical protein
MRRFIFISLFLLSATAGFAQTQIQNSGWLTFVNTTKIDKNWGFTLDAQLRSADNWAYIRNVLIRPGISYALTNRSTISAGYLYATTHTESAIGNTTFLEQRVYEQYIFNHKLKSSFAMHRLRLEQRFIETAGNDIFAQRLRYLFRIVKPLAPYKESFNKGLFVALQDEIFLNVQSKELLNKSLFDQNRLYLAIGYRVSKSLDIEGGYLNQYINAIGNNTSNRVAQLAIYTRF